MPPVAASESRYLWGLINDLSCFSFLSLIFLKLKALQWLIAVLSDTNQETVGMKIRQVLGTYFRDFCKNTEKKYYRRTVKTGQNDCNSMFHSMLLSVNPLSANSSKWSNTLKQFVGYCRRQIRRLFIKLKSKYNFQEKFSFKPVPVKYVESIIKNIPNIRAAGGELPLHILKQSGFTYQMSTDCINDALSQGIFPDSLKLANVTPVHKKDETTVKENYRPVSVLPLFSKIFEKVIYGQLSQYLEKDLNGLLCGFREAHSSQHALFKLLQAWQEELDKSGFVGTIVMDLSL